MAPERLAHRRYRCRSCGRELPARLHAAQAIDGAMLLGHLGQQHAEALGPYLARMATGADIAETAAEAFDVEERRTHDPTRSG